MGGTGVVARLFELAALCVFLGTLTGCSWDADQPGPGVVVRDTLPSGRIVARVTATEAPPAWELRERFRIGVIEGDGPDVFGEVRDVELGPRGETFVLDGQAAEVRVFGGEGTYLRTLARPGEGPGELNRPAGLTLDRDGNVWVLNWGNSRYTAFDPATGDVVEEHRRLASFVAFRWPGAFDAEGRLIDVGLDQTGEPAILRLDSDFVPSDTLPFPTADDAHQILIRRGEMLVMSALDPFAPQPAWSPGPDGIVVGEGGAYRLHRIGFDGDTMLTVEVSAPSVRVTASERDSVLTAFQELVESSGGTPERQPRVPDTKPAHGPILLDEQNRLWVQRLPAAGEAPGWDVLGAEGDYVAYVRLPIVVNAVLRSVRADRVAVSAELAGVPTVIVYDLVKGSG